MLTTAQRLVDTDLRRVEFLMGVDAGRWDLAEPFSVTVWPFVYTMVQAASRPNSPEQLLVRWDLENYSEQSPTGAFWDADTKSFLAPARWPKGRPGTPVATVFKVEGWAAPGRGFYHPYDRQARLNHNDWPAQNPQFIWTKDNTIVDFLHLVHRWLNCEDYLGC